MKRSHKLKKILQFKAEGLLKYVWLYNEHQALKG